MRATGGRPYRKIEQERINKSLRKITDRKQQTKQRCQIIFINKKQLGKQAKHERKKTEKSNSQSSNDLKRLKTSLHRVDTKRP